MAADKPEIELETFSAPPAVLKSGSTGDGAPVVVVPHDEHNLDGDEEEQEDVKLMGDSMQQLLLKFEHVSHVVSVPGGTFFKREYKEKVILDDMSGVAKPGEVLAIMGPSGGGKTSLLNVLAGRIGVVSGTITLNHKPLPHSFNRIAAYVMQDDLLPATLTPRELFTFAANLRLAYLTREERKQRVEFIIRTLGLRNAANTIVGDHLLRGLSGGERKRTSIGYELITNPSLIFLDEPTSGLDAFTSYSLMLTLRKLARQGRTIITTIHQPSSEIFMKFDRLILLARGRMVYNGPATDSMDYFRSIGHEIASFTNPADFYMEILHSQTPEDIARVTDIADAYRSREAALMGKLVQETENMQTNIVEKPSKRPGLFTEIGLLAQRTLRMNTRNPIVLRARLGQTVVIAVIAGLVFTKLGTNQVSIQGRNGSLFFNALSQAMGALMSGVLTMPLERNLLVREQNSGMYRIISYYTGKSLVQTVINIIIATFFILIVYWFIGYSNTAAQFFVFWAMVQNMVFAADSLGIMLGCSFPNPVVAVSIAPVILLPLMLYGGLYVNLGSIGPWLYWLQFVSVFKWCYEALLINEYTGMTLYCEPNELVGMPPNQACPITTGEQQIAKLGLQFTNVWESALILFAFGLLFRILGLVFLQIQTRRVLRRN